MQYGPIKKLDQYKSILKIQLTANDKEVGFDDDVLNIYVIVEF